MNVLNVECSVIKHIYKNLNLFKHMMWIELSDDISVKYVPIWSKYAFLLQIVNC